MADKDPAKAPSVKQLQADLAKLTSAHDVMVKQNIKDKEAAKKTIDDLNKKLEAEKEQAKKQREESAAKTVTKMRALINASKHTWVQVFHKGLKDGIDFSFTYEGLIFKFYSGTPIFLSEIVQNHLKMCRRPQAQLSQGTAGGAPKMSKGWYHNYTVQNCEPPEGAKETEPAPELVTA